MNNNDFIISFLEYLSKERNFSNHTIRNYKIDLIEFADYLNGIDSNLIITDIDILYNPRRIEWKIIKCFIYKYDYYV